MLSMRMKKEEDGRVNQNIGCMKKKTYGNILLFKQIK